jgi:DNA processing protein
MDRNTLIAYSLKYEGDPYRIARAIKNNESIKIPSFLPQCVCLLDDAYPTLFRGLRHPPFVIYYHGDLDLLKRPSLGVVGSRDASLEAMNITSRIVSTLAQKYVIISGMARGIDACAHHASLSTGTIAVLGSGIDMPYPASNLDLYNQIKKQGLILSEYPGQTRPLKHHFPYRNRLIACASQGLVVTQAKCKSGTMLTVKEALELGREVYVVPYPFDSIEGSGCNLLIQQGATILTNLLDLDII